MEYGCSFSFIMTFATLSAEKDALSEKSNWVCALPSNPSISKLSIKTNVSLYYRILIFFMFHFLDAFLLNFHMIWSMMFLVIVLLMVSTRPCALSVLRTALSWPSKS